MAFIAFSALAPAGNAWAVQCSAAKRAPKSERPFSFVSQSHFGDCEG